MTEPTDHSNTLAGVLVEINRFRDERDWRQFHNAKDLALSITLEAAELLENFQWRTAEEAVESRLDAISHEIADVLIYTLMLADDLGLDPADIIRTKVRANGEKYPVDRSRGRTAKYDEV